MTKYGNYLCNIFVSVVCYEKTKHGYLKGKREYPFGYYQKDFVKDLRDIKIAAQNIAKDQSSGPIDKLYARIINKYLGRYLIRIIGYDLDRKEYYEMYMMEEKT